MSSAKGLNLFVEPVAQLSGVCRSENVVAAPLVAKKYMA